MCVIKSHNLVRKKSQNSKFVLEKDTKSNENLMKRSHKNVNFYYKKSQSSEKKVTKL